MLFQKCLIYVTPHNWYDHVLTGQINRPLKLAEQFYNHKLFSEMLIVNRLRPDRILRVKNSDRQLLIKRGFFNLFYDTTSEVYYLEHCLPFGKIEERFLPYIIKFVMRKMKFKEAFLWICDPKSEGLLLKFNTMNHLFDAYDDWSLSPFYRQRKRHLKYILRGYLIAKEYAPLIITNTNQMKNKLSTDSNKVILIGNTSSLKIKSVSTSSPESLSYSENKVVGYIGNIHERIDLNLVAQLADYFKKVHFVFIGKNDFRSDRFEKLLLEHINIRFLGPKAYDEIPAFISQFDVCFIPHVVNEYTLSQDSMKMYDYLQCGKPVVTTAIPPADRLGHIIYVGHTHQEFIDQLAKALVENNNKIKNERLNYMENNTWKKKAEQICALLEG